MRVLPCCNTQLTFCTLGDRLPEAICPSTEPGASCAEGPPLVGGGRPKTSQEEEGRTYETNQAEGFPMWAAICFAANFAEHQCYKKKPPPKNSPRQEGSRGRISLVPPKTLIQRVGFAPCIKSLRRETPWPQCTFHSGMDLGRTMVHVPEPEPSIQHPYWQHIPHPVCVNQKGTFPMAWWVRTPSCAHWCSGARLRMGLHECIGKAENHARSRRTSLGTP